MGGQIVKCNYCEKSMGHDTPIFKIYHTGQYGEKYMCRDCLIPRISLIKDDTTYSVQFFDQMLNFPIITNDKEYRISC
jgi:hypothetical protein